MTFKTFIAAVALLIAVAPAHAQDPSELVVRIDRLEAQIRQMTGTIEQLQFRNQQLEQQLRAAQSGQPAAAQQAARPSGQMAPPNGPQGAPQAAPSLQPEPMQQAAGPSPLRPVSPRARGDVFDPSQNPTAPGAPRALGGGGSIVAPEPGMGPPDAAPPIGAPGGREAGAPLDLGALSGNAAYDPSLSPNSQMTAPPRNQNPNNPANPNAVAAVAPPGNTPKDEYDLAYGYVLRKDYALAEETFRSFLRKNPNDKMVPDAQYWLGESFYQRQRYQDAADNYLIVVRNHDQSGKAPDSLLRLGQSLAAIGQKEMACASLAEVTRKYPRASASVKRGVEQEQKRAKC